VAAGRCFPGSARNAWATESVSYRCVPRPEAVRQVARSTMKGGRGGGGGGGGGGGSAIRGWATGARRAQCEKTPAKGADAGRSLIPRGRPQPATRFCVISGPVGPAGAWLHAGYVRHPATGARLATPTDGPPLHATFMVDAGSAHRPLGMQSSVRQQPECCDCFVGEVYLGQGGGLKASKAKPAHHARHDQKSARFAAAGMPSIMIFASSSLAC